MVVFGVGYLVFCVAFEEFRMDYDIDFRRFMVWLFRLVFIFIILYVSYQVLQAILGGTWESENIIIAGVGIVMAGFFVIVGFLIKQAHSIGRMEVGLRTCFDKIRVIEEKDNEREG